MNSFFTESAILAQAALLAAMPKKEDASHCLSDTDSESTADVRSTGCQSDTFHVSCSSDAGPVDGSCSSNEEPEDLDVGVCSDAAGHLGWPDQGFGSGLPAE